MASSTHGVVVPFRLPTTRPVTADAMQNLNNPMPNGNGALPGPVNGPATDNSPTPPPLPPPQPEPEANFVIGWNEPNGCFSGCILDEHFPFV
ncbi:hypothetical protein FRB91_011234 [Serendipita sp. 411]|nr:hypothetical protein FRB91_011234 [Serendipita sp. 411]